MKLALPLVVCTVLIASHDLFAQHLFPEKYSGCVTDEFALERDHTTAKVSDEMLIGAITGAWDEKIRQKISGALTLQIIVDLEGNSCLISVKNDTNVRTNRMNLKEAVDKNLLWEEPSKKVGAIVVMNFRKGKISLKRLGVDAGKGVHELTN